MVEKYKVNKVDPHPSGNGFEVEWTHEDRPGRIMRTHVNTDNINEVVEEVEKQAKSLNAPVKAHKDKAKEIESAFKQKGVLKT